MANNIEHHPHLVVTVHGIRTFGRWQERLEVLARRESASEVEFANYKYGYFSVIAFIIPFFRWLVVRKFRRELLKLCADTSRIRIDLVGHSFGTHIIAWGIAGLPSKLSLPIHTVILSGSVLRAGFPWRDLIGKRIKRVINDCGTRDGALLLSQFFVLFTGMAGRTGFSGLTGDVFRNRYSVFGHSGYFQDAHGNPTDLYMSQNWLPVLLTDERIAEFDNRDTTAVEGLITALANNIEPIKLTLYAAPFILLSWWIYGLYLKAENQRLEAERQRDLAYITQTRFFADLSRQKVKSDAVTAALIAIEGMPDASSGIFRPFVLDAERQLYDAIDSQRETFVMQGSAAVREVQYIGGQRILGRFNDGSIRVWENVNDKPHLLLSSKPREALTAEPSSGGNRIVTRSENNVVRIWDGQAGRVIREIPDTREVWASAISRDGRYLATASKDMSAELWDLATGQSLIKLDSPVERLDSFAFSSDASLIVGVGPSRIAEVWDVRSGKRRKVLDATEVSTARFMPGKNQIAVEGKDAEIIIFDAETGKRVSSISTNYDRNYIAGVSQDGTRLIVSADTKINRSEHDKATILYDANDTSKTISTISEYHEFNPESDVEEIGNIAFNSNVKRIVVLRGKTEAILLDWSGRKIISFAARYVDFSRDKKWIVSISINGDAEARNAETGELVFAFRLDGGSAIDADIDERLEHVVTAEQDGTIRILRREEPSKLVTLNGRDTTNITGLQFSPDGETIATASPPQWLPRGEMFPGDVSIWDPRTGRRLASHTSDAAIGDRGLTITPIYSSDGKRVLIKSDYEYAPIVWTWKAGVFEQFDKFSSDISSMHADEIAAIEHEFPTPEPAPITVRKTDDGLIVQDMSGRRFPTGARTPTNVGLAAVSPDLKALAVAEASDRITIMPLLGDATSFFSFAKAAMPRCLTPAQRMQYNMEPIPPRWCITGAGREQELDPAKWSGVWPYNEAAYRNWLVAADKAGSRSVSRWSAVATNLFGVQSTAVLPNFPMKEEVK